MSAPARSIRGKTVTIREGMMAYCKLLGRSWTHVTAVLKGERQSAALLRQIEAECPELFDLFPGARERLNETKTKETNQ